MASAGGYGADKSTRQKLGPFALTILLHLIVVAIFLLFRSNPIPMATQDSLKTFFLPDDGDKSADATKAEKKEQAREKPAESAAPVKPNPVVKPQETPIPPPVVQVPSYLNMTSAEFAASNIANMPSYKKSQGDSDQGDSKSAVGPGGGPGGVRLYDADWFRRPTQTELSTYIPHSAPRVGWGLIACQTVARYHVENCQTLGESPVGSGFGRAVREAAWQFLVLPPRVNSKPQVGAWVRIRIDYTEDDKPTGAAP